MQLIEILVIVFTSIFLISMIALFIYKKVTKSFDDCGCHAFTKKKTKKMVNEIKEELDSNKCCCQNKK